VIGSALVDWERSPERHDFSLAVGGESVVPTHFLAAFGPRHEGVRHAAVAVQQDPLEQRRWERQRDSNLAVAEALVARQSVELDEWRRGAGIASGRPDSDPTELQT